MPLFNLKSSIMLGSFGSNFTNEEFGFIKFDARSKGRKLSTNAAVARLLTKLMRDIAVGKFIVPIVPDEARTFGIDALSKVAGIYSYDGRRHTPQDGCHKQLSRSY